MSSFFSDAFLNGLVWGLLIAVLAVIPLEYVNEWRKNR
jgi:hypothetical protein